MTTGTKRTIDELLEEEENNGYQTMTDEELNRLIEWKTNRAKHLAEIELLENEYIERNKDLKEISEKQLEYANNIFKQIINIKPDIKTVDGSEVE